MHDEMIVFHYMDPFNIEAIQSSSYRTGKVAGLGGSRIGQDYEKAYNHHAVWALFEAEPIEWTSNLHFPFAWRNLRANIGSLLMEILVAEQKKEIWVFDWGYMEAFLRPAQCGLNDLPEYVSASGYDAEMKYFESRMPLEAYAKKTGQVFQLPEVVFMDQVVPLSSLRISKNQPEAERIWKILARYDSHKHLL